ncbi:MAG: AMP-binding protein [Ilumatobacteraceae bacterium]
MNRLVALDMPGDAQFVEAMKRIWDAGDAVFPIDQRLPVSARVSLLQEMAPSAIVDANGTESKMPGGRPVETGDALVIATSGSTGFPKGVVLTHGSIAASAAASNRRLGTMSNDHWLACLPLSHVGGLSVVIRALRAGCLLTVHPTFDASRVEESARNGATMTSLVATALSRVNASLFRTILLGGSAAPNHTPENIVITYGMTETGSGVVYNGAPLDGVEVRLSTEGEISLRAPMLLRCYRDGIDPKDTGGWFLTDDSGEFTSDGRLVVHGRRGDLIITGGENVWPQRVEAVLALHPRINEVVVRGVPDSEWGQRVVAWITTVKDSVVSLDEVREWVKNSLPTYCAPKSIYILDALPRTTSGKIDVQRLLASLPE